jgi:hypothetical protein
MAGYLGHGTDIMKLDAVIQIYAVFGNGGVLQMTNADVTIAERPVCPV